MDSPFKTVLLTCQPSASEALDHKDVQCSLFSRPVSHGAHHQLGSVQETKMR